MSKDNPYDKNSQLLDHNYDGIQEYDNPIPGWWNWIFVGSVVFGVLYWIFFESGVAGRDVHSQFERAYAASLEKRFGSLPELSGDERTLVQYMNDPEWLQVGATTFQTNCVSCHGREGGGGASAPNLTDDSWKNVRTIEDVYKVISEGAANGAMPAWKSRLRPKALVLTASYVASLRGTNPSGTVRPPEGNVIPPWPKWEDTKSEFATDADAKTQASAEKPSPGTAEETSTDQ